MNIRRRAVVVGLAAVLGGGAWLYIKSTGAMRDSEPRAAAASGPLTHHAHESGLTLEVPARTYAVDVTPAGLRIRACNAATVRNPWTLDLEFRAHAVPDADMPAAASAKIKQLGERRVTYLLTSTTDGGSGGEQHTLTAWTACGRGQLRAIWQQQMETPLDAEFSSMWAILAGSGCGQDR